MDDQAPHLSWFPFYPGDYLRDTRHLTLTQHGAYLLLLLTYYSIGPLPADRKALYRITGARSTRERREIDLVLDSFFEHGTDKKLHNGRADLEIEARTAKHKKLSNAGKKGMGTRWGDREEKGQPGYNQVNNEAIARPQPQPQPQNQDQNQDQERGFRADATPPPPKAVPPVRATRRKAKTPREPPPPVIEALRLGLGRYPRRDLWPEIIKQVDGRVCDLERLTKHAKEWTLRGFNPSNFVGVIEYHYEQEEADPEALQERMRQAVEKNPFLRAARGEP